MKCLITIISLLLITSYTRNFYVTIPQPKKVKEVVLHQPDRCHHDACIFFTVDSTGVLKQGHDIDTSKVNAIEAFILFEKYINSFKEEEKKEIKIINFELWKPDSNHFIDSTYNGLWGELRSFKNKG